MVNRTITRRSFLTGTTAAAMGCVAAGTIPGPTVFAQANERSAPDKKPAIRIGALDGVLSGGDGLSWEQTYHRAKELGVEGIELGVGEEYDKTALWEAKGRKHLRAVSETTDVLTPSICLHSYWWYSFADEDEAVRRRAVRLAREAAVAAKEMGAKNILIPFTNPDGVEAELARERWIAGTKASAPAAEKAGVTYCLENVGTSFADKAEDIITVVDAVDSPAVKVYYDAGNAVKSGNDPLRAIRLLKDRIRQVHVKEIKGEFLGEGVVPWPKIIEALRAIKYSGWLILETDATDDPKGAAKKNLETVRRLLKQNKTR